MHPSLLVAPGPRVLLAGLGAGLSAPHRRTGAAAGPSAGRRKALALAPAFPLALSGSSVVFARVAGNVPRHRAGSAASGQDRSGLWLRNAAAGLCVLAAAAAAVSFTAQYQLADATRRLTVVAALEAAIPDAAALVFACLGVALALQGRRAIRARTLNLASVGTSVFMNAIAAAPGWRNLAIWAMPPIVYALASDTLIGVVRAWTLARHHDPAVPDAGDTATPLAAVGGLILWLLRLTLAPASTLSGFRAWVLTECPTAPARRAPRPPLTPAPAPRVAPSPQLAGVPRPTKTARFLALATERHGPLAAIPLHAVAGIAAALAPQADLNPGAARTALRRAVLTARNGDPR